MKKEKIFARVIFYGFGLIATIAGLFLMFTFVSMVEAWAITKEQIAMCIIYIVIVVLYMAFIKMLNEKW